MKEANSLSSLGNIAAGFGTIVDKPLVAGLHRASPSTTLDEIFDIHLSLCKIISSKFHLSIIVKYF
jgi:hypothetical protein